MTAPRHNTDAGGLKRPEGILLERMGLDRALARSSLANFKVRVISLVAIDLRPLSRALRSWGMQTVKWDENLALVIVDSYLNPELESVIHTLGAVDILVVQPVGVTYHIGPLLRPGARCWQCIKQGLQYHQPLLIFIQNHTTYEGPLRPPLAFHPGTLNLCWYRVCLDLALYVLQDTHPLLEGHIISTDLASGQQSKHTIDHLALCPACRQRKRSGEQGFPPIIIDQDEENREASTAGLQRMHARNFDP